MVEFNKTVLPTRQIHVATMITPSPHKCDKPDNALSP